MTFGQTVHFLLLASGGHYLAATHYSLDGGFGIKIEVSSCHHTVHTQELAAKGRQSGNYSSFSCQ
jgi:hypothetical protein